MRLLIGSCGGLTGVYLSKMLRKLKIANEEMKIYGFDISSEIPTKFFLDKLFIITKATDELLFIDHLIEILNENNIDIYIPLHSEECRVVSKYREKIFNSTKTKFMISSYNTFQMLDDKMMAYKALNDLGIKTPKIYISYEEIHSFPVIAKPRRSSGSKGLFFCNSIEEVQSIKRECKDLLFMEYVKGTEYTVDAFFNSKSELITYNQRIRIKTLGGAAIISRNDFKVDVKYEIEKIALKYGIVGPSNFQFFLTDHNEIKFTDINLRFASGGLPLSVESGANIVELLILELLNIKYNPNSYQSDRKPRIMYKYFEERFESTDK